MEKIILLFICCNSLFSCHSQTNVVHLNKAIDLSNFDLSIKPQDDFYNFVNGNWLKNNPIPNGQNSWGTFSILRKKTSENIEAILSEISNNKELIHGSDDQKIRDFYNTASDSTNIDEQKNFPLLHLWAKVDSIKNNDDLSTVMGWLQKSLCNTVFRFYANPDPKNTAKTIAFIDQYGGYNLPDRNFYVKEDSASQNIVKNYEKHIIKMMMIAGKTIKEASNIAQSSIKIETICAINAMSEEDFRNPELTYHKMNLEQLQKIIPNFNCVKYFDAMGLKYTEEINVISPSFFHAFNEALVKQKLDDWKNYLMWCIINASANYISQDFRNEKFDFFERQLNGVSAMKTKKETAIEEVQNQLGWLIAKQYVNKHFNPNSKKLVLQMVENIKEVFESRLNNLDWMSKETKAKAVEKLRKIRIKIGFPDVWRDFSALQINADNYLKNVIACNQFNTARQASQVGKPTIKDEWGMTPQEVNAYYNPLQNEIVFPAAILQAPFFNENFDVAVNYGGIGAVIAHEFTHAFDDEGSQYDADGNLNNWWTIEDKENFKAKQQLIIHQYDNCIVLDSLKANGTLCVGENIADLGGVSIAYDAYKLYEKNNALKTSSEDGFDPDQRFFIAWTQIWRQNKTKEALILQVNTMTTSPYKLRAIAPLSNFKPFLDAFYIKDNDKMALSKDKRFAIW